MDDSDLPGLSDLFALVEDEHGNPRGIQPVEARLDEAAAALEPEAVLAALESAKEAPLAFAAVFLSVRSARSKPALVPKLQKALLRLVSDLRTAQAVVGGVPQVFDLAACAFGAYFELISLRPPDMVAILGVLGACLVNPRRADLSAAAVHQFHLLFKDDPRYERAAEEVAELLADAVEDSGLSPATRVRAYEAIVCGARFSASSRHPNPVADKVFGKQRLRAADALVAAVEKGPAKPELREYVLSNLSSIRPEAIASLQEKGILLLGTIPDPGELVNFEQKVPDPAKAGRLSLRLTPGQLLDSLKGTDASPQQLSAVFLAPFFSRRTAWQELGESLLRLSSSDQRVEVRSASAAVAFQLGAEAALSLLALLRNVPMEEEHQTPDWLFKGLSACLKKGVNASWAPLAPVMDYLFELHSREAETKGKLKSFMQEVLTKPECSAKSRIAAFCTYRNIEREADVWAQAAMLDPKEDPEFAGLLRSLTH
ncbi:MAG: hypothetical protein HY924_16170 [Elusimicrobia bacterium]|nr:hypothetical protein [Elusimicrobiota bacterium]